jgi:4-hydroxybenzoate polyprenyltransferase
MTSATPSTAAGSNPLQPANDPAVVVAAERSIPLVVDLDDTLVRTDTLYEMALALLKQKPLKLLSIAAWLMKGRAYLKQRLAETVNLECETLPLNEEVVAMIKDASGRGRKVVIATATDQRIAEQTAARLEEPVAVYASDGTNNLKGKAKAERLTQLFPQGFDYAGDSRADLPVWQAARNAIVVNASKSTLRRAKATANVTDVLPRPKPIARALVKSMRPHQWMKNVLIFVPAVLSGRIFDPAAWPALVLAFLALGLVASATYIVNDAWDIRDDRLHWSKRKRPLASGDLPLGVGIAMVPVGLVAGFALAFAAGLTTAMAVGIYLVLTLTYSFYLKRIIIHDALALASLFTLRLAVGTVAVHAQPSPWLFVFSMFFFLSLALAKRHTEIARVLARGGKVINGRGYRPEDLPLVLSAGISSGIAAVVIMVLYISSDAFRLSFRGDGEWLWGFPPLIFIIVGRIWSVCQRDELDDDPVVFAVKDHQCQAALAAAGICFLFAWFGFPFL